MTTPSSTALKDALSKQTRFVNANTAGRPAKAPDAVAGAKLVLSAAEPLVATTPTPTPVPTPTPTPVPTPTPTPVPTPPAGDSPAGTKVTSPGDKLWLNGMPFSITAQKTIQVGAKITAKSGNVVGLKLVGAGNGLPAHVEQKADWGQVGTFFVPADGSEGAYIGTQYSDEIATIPGDGSVILPPGFKAFNVLDFGVGDWSKPWVKSNWWKDRFSWIPENVIVDDKGAAHLIQNDMGSAEIFMTQAFGPARFEVMATVPRLKEGEIICPIFLYENSRSFEFDNELVGLAGSELRVHTAGGADAWLKEIHNAQTGTHIHRMDYIPGVSNEWFLDGQSYGRVVPADLQGKPFPDLPMQLCIDNWASGGWGGNYRGGDPLDIIIHGCKVTPL